jgi:hypothetical protein
MSIQQLKWFALLLTAGSGIVAAGPFTNGGFESPNIGTTFDFTTVPTGWTKFDPSCGGTANCPGSALFLENYGVFSLPTAGGEGVQAYGFGGNSVGTGSITQSFDTLAGGVYRVGFQYLVQQGSGFEDLVLDAFNGVVSGVSSSSTGCTVGGAGCLATSGRVQFNNTAWVTRTLDFTATGTTSTIRFSDFSGVFEPVDNFAVNWGLDAVSVTQIGGAPGVPEPSTVVLVGLGGLAVVCKRLVKRDA